MRRRRPCDASASPPEVEQPQEEVADQHEERPQRTQRIPQTHGRSISAMCTRTRAVERIPRRMQHTGHRTLASLKINHLALDDSLRPEWVCHRVLNLSSVESLGSEFSDDRFGPFSRHRPDGYSRPIPDIGGAVISRVERILVEHPELADCGATQSAELIEAAERSLGTRFPASFKDYLSRWGHISFGPNEYFGLGGASFGVVERTMFAREHNGIPPMLVAVCDHDGDEFVCLKTDGLKDGECPVVIWDVPSRTISRTRADSFGAFLASDMQAFID